jgi:hypothetical protein
MLEVVCCSAVVPRDELNGNPGRGKLPPPGRRGPPPVERPFALADFFNPP